MDIPYAHEQAWELATLSIDTGRQIGLLIDRQGHPMMILAGTASGIFIPELPRGRTSTGRLRGFRLLHTHLGDPSLSQEDLMDMLFLRLDSVGVLAVGQEGKPKTFSFAHLLPPNAEHLPYRIHPPVTWDRVNIDLASEVTALEAEFARTGASFGPGTGENRAVLVSVGTAPKSIQERSLDELKELCRTAGLTSAARLVQRVPKINPKHILGKGKLADLEILALQNQASVVVFDRELSPSQMRDLAEITERKILDRTQLILDIFAQHAVTRAGKLQVEMAQMKYSLPRLVGQSTALSRLAGGIGGRGPGESKLELDRRKVKDRITQIKTELDKLRRHRSATRTRRAKTGIPIVALVGYTNAGKSTLLNSLTRSDILAENKLFATLDPTSRRVRFPQDRDVIITDTVGFIRELPEDLKEAFKATLEELDAADLLIHVADASHPEMEAQMAAVEGILEEMDLANLPRLLVLNKLDGVGLENQLLLGHAYPEAVKVSALKRLNLTALVQKILAVLPCKTG